MNLTPPKGFSTLTNGLISISLGIVISIQSRANGVLAVKMNSSFGGALASQIAAWIFIIPIFLFNRSARKSLTSILPALRSKQLHWWELTGGVFGGLFLSIQSYTVPIIGVALFTIALIAGQTLGSLIVDRTAFSPSGKQPITFARFMAAFFTLISVVISVIPELRHSTLKFLPLLLTLFAGIFIAMTQGVNGRSESVLKNSMPVTFLNFLFGTIILCIGLTITFLSSHPHLFYPRNPWYYIGGPAGLLYIAISAIIVKYIGVLKFVLYLIAGQLTGALILDWLMPTSKSSINSYVVVGTLATFLSIVIANRFQKSTEAV
jgi:transporter family-2 protein